VDNTFSGEVFNFEFKHLGLIICKTSVLASSMYSYNSLEQIWHNIRFLCLALLDLCNCAYYRKTEKQWWQSISTCQIILNRKRFRQMLTYPDFIIRFILKYTLTSMQNSVRCILCSEWFQERINFIAIDIYICFSIIIKGVKKTNKTKRVYLFDKVLTTDAKYRSLFSRT
jgi:hypothetical protein